MTFNRHSILVRQAPQSRVEKQLAFLTKRQGQFRQAALEAKKRGEIEQAKEYLRMSKGFDQLIEVTRSGLPVDMNTVSRLYTCVENDFICFEMCSQ